MYSNPRRVKIDTNEMKRLDDQGYTQAQLADHFGVSKTTIANRLRAIRSEQLPSSSTERVADLFDQIQPTEELPKDDLSTEDLNQIRYRRRLGHTYKNIAADMGLDEEFVFYQINPVRLTSEDLGYKSWLYRQKLYG